MIKENTYTEILDKVQMDLVLQKNDIVKLLSIENVDELDRLFRAAREVRNRIFSNKVFLYGFVYFSTWCRNNCNFCYYRKENSIKRYRKNEEEIVDIVRKLADSGVHLIDLTMGEDSKYHREHFKTVLSIIKKTKKSTNLPIMISPGVVENKLIDEFVNAGADWYALYQETNNRELFSRLRLRQDYDERMNAKLYAKSKGLLIEEGILAGVGETLEDIADSILKMDEIGARQVRVMSFVPQKGIPMENVKTSDRKLELKIIAIMRLLYPDALIPASLDIDGISGLKVRMDAGANVITSIIPPREGLMGVAQNVKDVDDGGRSVEEVTSILSEIGLEPATAEEYKNFINRKKAEGRC